LFFYSKEIDISSQALTSPFCHIEGTIGLLNDLPLQIINENGVREEGIIKGRKFCTKDRPLMVSLLYNVFAYANKYFPLREKCS